MIKPKDSIEIAQVSNGVMIRHCSNPSQSTYHPPIDFIVFNKMDDFLKFIQGHFELIKGEM